MGDDITTDEDFEARLHKLETEAVATMRALVDKYVPISEVRVEKLTTAYRESLNDYTELLVEQQLEKKKIADTVYSLKQEMATLNEQVMLLTATTGGDQLTKLQVTMNDIGARLARVEAAGGFAVH